MISNGFLAAIATNWLTQAWLLADESAGGDGGAGAGDAPAGFEGVPFQFLLPIVLLLFYFMVLRPQQRGQNKLQTQLETLKAKDRVVTIGGIHGVVTNVQRDQETVTLRIDESTGTKMRVGLSAVKEVVNEDAQSEDTQSDSTKSSGG